MSSVDHALAEPPNPHIHGPARPSPSRARRLTSVLATAGITLAATALVHFVDPNQPGHYPACGFYAVTGRYCPGCGSMRALHFLTNGDISAAWSMNPALVITVPVAVVGWSIWLYRAATGHTQPLRIPLWLPWTVAGMLVVFGIVRNLPGFEFLAPH